MLNNLGVLVTPGQMSLPRAHEAFDAQGSLRDPAQHRMLEQMIMELLLTTQAVRQARA